MKNIILNKWHLLVGLFLMMGFIVVGVQEAGFANQHVGSAEMATHPSHSPQILSLSYTGALAMSGEPCPESGVWPPGCIPRGSNGHSGGAGQPCPTSGVWPAGCVPNGGGSSGNSGAGQPCPTSGVWTAGCIPNGGGTTIGGDLDGDFVFGGDDACPNTPETYNSVRDEDGCPDDLQSYMESHTDTLNQYWSAEFNRLGRIYREPISIRYFYGTPDEAPNAFYMPIFNSMWIDLRLIEQARDEFGDYSAATVLAHEWGHMIQDYLRILTQDRTSRSVELQADCFAGSYTKYAESIDMTENGDPQEALAIMFAIGDDALGFDLSHDEEGAHGTSAERQAAFNNGYKHGTQTCYASYP